MPRPRSAVLLQKIGLLEDMEGDNWIQKERSKKLWFAFIKLKKKMFSSPLLKCLQTTDAKKTLCAFTLLVTVATRFPLKSEPSAKPEWVHVG